MLDNKKLIVFLNTILGNYLYLTFYIPIIGLLMICSSLAFDYHVEGDDKISLTVIGGIQMFSLILVIAWIINLLL